MIRNIVHRELQAGITAMNHDSVFTESVHVYLNIEDNMHFAYYKLWIHIDNWVNNTRCQ